MHHVSNILARLRRREVKDEADAAHRGSDQLYAPRDTETAHVLKHYIPLAAAIKIPHELLRDDVGDHDLRPANIVSVMLLLFEYLAHRNACATKQNERKGRIRRLPPVYTADLTSADNAILSQSVAETVSKVQSGVLNPVEIVRAFGKKALQAHEATNCLTEILLPEAEEWAMNCNKQGPLAGMPVSMKDTAGVAGWDACIGYSSLVGKPMKKDSALVRLLRDAGAVPFVKTNIPITLLSFESNNDVFGKCTNPHNSDYAPGGSTGGEAALLAYGGSRIGIGTDVAGSVRCPAHYSGIYTIKASMHRVPKSGNSTSIPGQIGIPAVYSPMTRTLGDLDTMWRAIVSMEPWKYDYSCIPLPWREVDLSGRKLKFGVIWDDGIVVPSPACRRALKTVVDTLKSDGHEVVDIDPPSPYEALQIGSELLFADAGKTCTKPIRWGEWNDIGVDEAMRMLRVPRFIKKLYAWYLRHIRGDAVYAGLIEKWHEKTVEEYYALVARRESYREKWFDLWNEQGYDFVLTVPNSLPAAPHGGMKEGFKACGYTFMFNVLDYSAGVLPVTHVDRDQDALLSKMKARNAIEAGQYKMYDSNKMHGLPVGVQVVGRRLEEEKVLEGMKLIEACLKVEGKAYKLLEVD
ncbi:hypothetical protein NM688_g6377 [Phlebia brevispora]|uniref:Uncharacterized protein n=1 Tax=Phlebia brevispora TaxID=194682 RepID=A0ACC1SGX6_9APHY|nr:hypothetical protein NM688_g6377 [Phlebia brevispora]